MEKGITVEKDDGRDTIHPGHTLEYKIKVSNTSNVDLFDVKVTDDLPSHVTVLNISHGGIRSGNVVTWNNIHLAKDGEDDDDITLSITVRVNHDTGNNVVLHNEVKARSNDYDIEDRDTDDTTVKRIAQIASVTDVPVVFVSAPPSVVPVPVTAKTGAGLVGLLSTLVGGAGLAVITRRSF